MNLTSIIKVIIIVILFFIINYCRNEINNKNREINNLVQKNQKDLKEFNNYKQNQSNLLADSNIENTNLNLKIGRLLRENQQSLNLDNQSKINDYLSKNERLIRSCEELKKDLEIAEIKNNEYLLKIQWFENEIKNYKSEREIENRNKSNINEEYITLKRFYDKYISMHPMFLKNYKEENFIKDNPHGQTSPNFIKTYKEELTNDWWIPKN